MPEGRGAGGCGGSGPNQHLLILLLIMVPLPSLTLSASRGGAGPTEGLLELSQAVTQLTQRFATLEVSLESRLVRLADTAARGEALIETLASRLNKVDSLVVKVDALDSRLTLETSSLKTTIRSTNRDLQGMATQLERLDSRVETGDKSRHDTRSSWSTRATDSDLSATITRSVGEHVERTLPRLLDHTLNTLQDALYKKINKVVRELQEEMRETREELEDLGTQTLTATAEAREDIKKGTKTANDALIDVKNKIHSVHQDLSLKITSTPSLGSLRPMLQQVNHTVVQSIARATAGINLTLLEEAARRRGGESVGEVFGQSHSLHCPDPATVAALLEVKHLLQSLLKKSEDLRRGLTKQTSEGVDLLKLLHQRFSVLLRRMNTEPDHGHILVAEMQDLGSLVESSYTAVLVAQNAFIDSCKRIQSEEPTLEHKITEILDKLVTDIDLGHQLNRQQLSELREVVERLGGGGSPLTITPTVDVMEGAVRRDQEFSAKTHTNLDEVREVILEATEEANITVSRLKSMEQRLEEVSSELVSTDWSDLRQKEPADQLVTAAKDLKGFAQEQIVQSFNLYDALMAALEQMPINGSVKLQDTAVKSAQPLKLMNDADTALTLPPSCTAALLEQVRSMPGLSAAPHTTPASVAESDSEDYVPAWYTDPDFLSGNYGTPDRGFPVFREEEWVDMDEDFERDGSNQRQSLSSPPITSTAPPTTAPPAVVNRYFGVKKSTNPPPLQPKQSSRRGAFP